MRIYEIAPGEKEELSDESDKYIQLVETNCSFVLPYIKKTRKFLYRGYMQKQLTAFKGQSRNNRQPLSFDIDIANKLDDMFDYEGILAKRSNSIYCTSSIDNAGFYTNYKPGSMGGPKVHSNVYIIFPINGFHFSWASKTSDLFGDWSAWSDSPMLRNNEYDELIEKYGITDRDLGMAIRSGHEILISGQYYAFNEQTFGGYFHNKLFYDSTGDDELLAQLQAK